MVLASPLADRLFKRIEDYYLEYLVESGNKDDHLTKLGFYASMKAAVQEEPLKDSVAQLVLMEKLEKAVSYYTDLVYTQVMACVRVQF